MQKISNYTYTRNGNKYTKDTPQCPYKRFMFNNSYTILVVTASLTGLILLGDWSRL